MEPIKLILLAINIKKETTLLSDIAIEDMEKAVLGDVIDKRKVTVEEADDVIKKYRPESKIDVSDMVGRYNEIYQLYRYKAIELVFLNPKTLTITILKDELNLNFVTGSTLKEIQERISKKLSRYYGIELDVDYQVYNELVNITNSGLEVTMTKTPSLVGLSKFITMKSIVKTTVDDKSTYSNNTVIPLDEILYISEIRKNNLVNKNVTSDDYLDPDYIRRSEAEDRLMLSIYHESYAYLEQIMNEANGSLEEPGKEDYRHIDVLKVLDMVKIDTEQQIKFV